MSASEALTIWMLSTAMKAPSVAPITASQVLAETAGAAGAAEGGRCSLAGMASTIVCSVVMVVSSQTRGMHPQRSAARLRATRREALFGFAFGNNFRLGIDRRHGRHARSQQPLQVLVVE